MRFLKVFGVLVEAFVGGGSLQKFPTEQRFQKQVLCSKTKIGICLQKFSTDQKFQKQIFCVAKLKMILKVVFISKTSLCFFEKL